MDVFEILRYALNDICVNMYIVIFFIKIYHISLVIICTIQKYLYICTHYKSISIMKSILLSIYQFYAEGFRRMTWGRPLWILIALKVIILFAVLRAFFFEPVLSGKTEDQKIEHVAGELIR